MLKSILNFEGTKTLNKKEQSSITGGGFWPTTEYQCDLCGGEWSAPLCALPSNSVCL